MTGLNYLDENGKISDDGQVNGR